MNCKQGDFAIWVGSDKTKKTNPNYGKVVHCLKFLGHVVGREGEDRWETDIDIQTTRGPNKGGKHRTVRDIALRPLTGTFEEMVAQVVAFRLTS